MMARGGLRQPLSAATGKNMAFYESSVAYQRIKKDLLLDLSVQRKRINPKEYQYELKVSSIPVREALIRLSEEDVIDVIPGKGYFTKGLDIQRTQECLCLLSENLKSLMGFLFKRFDRQELAILARYIERQIRELERLDSQAEKSQAILRCFMMIAGESKCQEAKYIVRRLTNSVHLALGNLFKTESFRDHCVESLGRLALGIGGGDLDASNNALDRLFETIGFEFSGLVEQLLEPRDEFYAFGA